MATGVFLFTDIEGSTRRWADDATTMREALQRHDRLLREAIGAADGTVFNHTGDGLVADFDSARAAVAAAAAGQRRLRAEHWPTPAPLLVRMALHAGEAQAQDEGWFGPALNRCARLLGTAHGGQVLLSGAAQALLVDVLPDGLALRPLGRHRLRDLAAPEDVFQLLGEGLESEFPPLRSLDAFRGNLPSQLTSFFGRELETIDVAGSLVEHRVVTLTGPGGMGKTRLSLAAAAAVVDKYPDGVWWVELAPVSEPAAVDHAIGAVLGLQPRAGLTLRQQVVEVLGRWRCLILLDNCEHLRSAVTSLVGELVSRCEAVDVLATSREPLGATGERVIPVRPLEIDTAAVALFQDRAAARTNASLDVDQLGTVRDICRQLDGMPLAIELAAARLRSMSARQLAERLDHRFRLLKAERAEPTARHGTLRAVVDWSYSLLADAERRLFDRLAVFAGGFDLAAAHAVCGDDGEDDYDTLDHLDALVSRSLLQVEDRVAGTRYSLLETMRQYGAERLEPDVLADLRTRHMRYYAARTEASWDGMLGPDDTAWVDWFADEVENLRFAFTWARQVRDDAVAVAIPGNLVLYARTFPLEVWDWARQAAALPGAERQPRANRLYQQLGWSHRFLGDIEAAMACVRAALEIEDRGNPEQDPGTSVLWGTVQYLAGNTEESGRIHELVEEMTVPLEPRYVVYRAWAAQADVFSAFERGCDPALMAQRARAAADGSGNARARLLALFTEGVACAESDPARSEEVLVDAAVVADRVRDANLRSAIRSLLAFVRYRDDPLSAFEGLVAALDSFKGAGAPYGVKLLMRDLLPALGDLGEHDLVALLDAAATKLTIRPRAVQAARDAARAWLGPSAFEVLQRRGAAMSIDEIDRLIRGRIGPLLHSQHEPLP